MRVSSNSDVRMTALIPGTDSSVQDNPQSVLSDAGMVLYLTASNVKMTTQWTMMGVTATVNLRQDGLMNTLDIKDLTRPFQHQFVATELCSKWRLVMKVQQLMMLNEDASLIAQLQSTGLNAHSLILMVPQYVLRCVETRSNHKARSVKMETLIIWTVVQANA